MGQSFPKPQHWLLQGPCPPRSYRFPLMLWTPLTLALCLSSSSLLLPDGRRTDICFPGPRQATEVSPTHAGPWALSGSYM